MKNLEGRIITSSSGKQYLLTEIAGEGAQGIVYSEASDQYIIKLYKKGTVYQNNKKYEKLDWLMKQSYPDQFIKPLDLFEAPYVGYVMEKVKEHSSLNKMLIPAREASFSEWYNKETGGLRRRFFIAYKIAMQFALLHETNRAYCDISGSNIMVHENPKIASICMIDIDNIYIPGSDSGNILGTSRYMAPEIMNKQMLPDIFTDTYSLAVILFEMLRVGHPYIGDMVEDGTPEQQEQAYLGLYPYVDEKGSINSSTQMLPEGVIFTAELKKLFYKTFVVGKENRVERTPARDFALACLEASNKVMKCSGCKQWHLATHNEERKYICPWCEEENLRPRFLRFTDRYYVQKNVGKDGSRERVLMKEEHINSFVLRDDKNDITDNYISNFYIKKDKFAKPVDQYFVIRKAKNGRFYLINSSGNQLYLQKQGEKNRMQILKQDQPIEIRNMDILFFKDINVNLTESENSALDDKYKGILIRYATFI